jgi:hypothetical protein
MILFILIFKILLTSFKAYIIGVYEYLTFKIGKIIAKGNLLTLPLVLVCLYTIAPWLFGSTLMSKDKMLSVIELLMI